MPVSGRFSISFPLFDVNLTEIYFIATVHCVYFDTFSLILCIFMINVFYLYKCWNSDEGESRKRSLILFLPC